MRTRRLFVAINLTEDIKERLGRVVEQLKKRGDPIKWETTEKLHITLKFLGNTKQNQISPHESRSNRDSTGQAKIKDQIENIAKNYYPFQLQLLEFKYFLERHFVLHIGLIGFPLPKASEDQGQTGLINKLWEEIEKSCEGLGFPREKQELTPHITIGRGLGKQPMAVWTRIGEKLKRIKHPKFPLINIDSIDLMERLQTKEGSEYERLYSAKLR